MQPSVRSFPLSPLLAGLLLTAAVLAPASAQIAAEDPVLNAYVNRVAELTRDGRALVQQHGKAYLIAEYEALINAHPGYEKNIQLETAIGEVYEWDFSNRGEPPNVEAAYEVYLGIIDRYDLSYEYSKLVYRRAAERAETLDPAAARNLYTGMMEAYPDDPVVQLESLYRLGALAERDGDLREARDLLDYVVNYDARSQTLNPDELSRIQTVQSQAASLLMALALDPDATADERLAALEAFLDENPALREEHGDVVQDFQAAMNRLRDNAPRDEVREAIAELQRLLAEHDSARAGVNAPTGEGSSADGEDAMATGRAPGWRPASEDFSAVSTSSTANSGDVSSSGYGGGVATDFDAIAGAAESESITPEANRAAAMTAAVVCALLTVAGLFALRKRFGL